MEQTKYLWGAAVLLIAVAVFGYLLMSSSKDKTDENYNYNHNDSTEVIEDNKYPKIDDSGQATFITPDKKAINFGFNGGYETVIIGADGKWSITDSPDWIKTYSKDGEIVINTTNNETGSVRNGSIVLSGKGDVTATINVIQASYTWKCDDDGKVTVNGVPSPPKVAVPPAPIWHQEKNETHESNKKNDSKTSSKLSLVIVKSKIKFGTELNTYARGCDYRVTHTVVVANKSNKDVPANAYYLTVSPVGKDEYGYSKKNKRKVSGKFIPANGTVTFTWTDVHFDGTWTYEDKVKLKILQ